MDLGTRIRVKPGHWGRSNAYGVVCDPGIEELAILNVPQNRLCIKFDTPGNGIFGLYLFMDERDIEISTS
jgi:hypothetical protein